VVDESPHSGRRVGRIVGDNRQHAWRQTLEHPATRLYEASGWFRAKGAKADPNPDGFARFYFHILYRDRPYSEATHVWTDIPLGTYDWRRLTVRLTPKTEWPVGQIWVTVGPTIRRV